MVVRASKGSGEESEVRKKKDKERKRRERGLLVREDEGRGQEGERVWVHVMSFPCLQDK